MNWQRTTAVTQWRIAFGACCSLEFIWFSAQWSVALFGWFIWRAFSIILPVLIKVRLSFVSVATFLSIVFGIPQSISHRTPCPLVLCTLVSLSKLKP